MDDGERDRDDEATEITAALEASDRVTDASRFVPVVRERLEVVRRMVPTARVRITTRPRYETVEVPVGELSRDEVQVERVPVGRFVEAEPKPRMDGEDLVVPVLEERLVKRLWLREELRIRTRRVAASGIAERVTLRTDDVHVERTPIAADAITEDDEHERAPLPPSRSRPTRGGEPGEGEEGRAGRAISTQRTSNEHGTKENES